MPVPAPQDVSTNVPSTRPARFQPPPVFHVPPGFLTSQRALLKCTPSRKAYTQPTPPAVEPHLYQ
ncbi:hypothetical protein [Streptomyces sp. NPDC058193]|uniref:hypothetical protein n=1 Tax=Streptomyces sp. NPDC058193 TaxID=3346373 RepID=UPI0036EDB86D